MIIRQFQSKGRACSNRLASLVLSIANYKGIAREHSLKSIAIEPLDVNIYKQQTIS